MVICTSLVSWGRPITTTCRVEIKRDEDYEIQSKEVKLASRCFLDDFLQLAFEKDGSVPPIVFEQVSFSHPVFISYTSGTTGLPKALVHGCGGLLAMAKEHFLNKDPEKKFNFLTMSPVGWVSWNIFTAYLFAGITMIVYEGVPYFLSPTYLWDLVDRFRISILFFTPSILDELEKRNYIPTAKHCLQSLEIFISGGSIVKPNNYDFVYNKVKKDILFSSGYGSTELMGSCMSYDSTLPIYKGEITCPSLAIDLECVDDSVQPERKENGDCSEENNKQHALQPGYSYKPKKLR